MLSLANVSPGHGATYYKTENYYLKADATAYSKWAGVGAERNGLSGAVEHHTFTQLLAGTHPTIEVGGTKANRRAGVDMTFSAPKSASIQALVFGDTRLVEAHRRAVDEALRFAEANYALYRDGPKEARVKVKGTGLLVAQFEHDTSRLKDPQLHTHNVVLNRVITRDGEVKALCADEIYTNSVLIGMIYQNSLARQVKDLGYGVKQGPRGTFEIEGFSPEALTTFSKRKEQISSHAPDSYRHTRELVLKDRKAKEGPQLREDLMDGWEAEAKAVGVAPLTPSKSPVRERPLTLEKVMDDALALASLRRADFKREDVIRGALEIGLGRFYLKAIEQFFDEAVGTTILRTSGGKSETFTSLAAVERDRHTRRMVEVGKESVPPLASREEIESRITRLRVLDRTSAEGALTRSDALRLELGANTPRFDSKREAFVQALAEGKRLSLSEITEARVALLEDLNDRPKAERKEVKTKMAVASVLAPLERAFLAPTAGQQDAIEKTLSSNDQVVIWQGVAGAGKTFSMRQIVEEARKAGVEVSGFAPSAAAAIQLQTEAGIEANTLQSHLLKRERRDEKTKLWIVDEAGMVSAADMNALLLKAMDAHARVLLVGDTRQLSPVDAGNPFADLQRNTTTTLAILDESLRQKAPDLQKAVAHMNKGEMEEAIQVLEKDVQTLRGKSDRIQAAAREYLEAGGESRDDVLLLTRTNESRADLTQRVREELKRQGHLGNAVVIETFERVDLPEPKQAHASSYLEGSLLVPTRKYRSLGLEKDASYEIENVDTTRNTLTVCKEGKPVVIDLAKTGRFTTYMKSTIEVAEGDRMIWNRNVKARDQVNNRGFVIETVTNEGITIRTDSNETLTLSRKERHHMEHAWALTVYKSQGRTTRNVVLYSDAAAGARDLLVATTRATSGVRIFASSKEEVKASATRIEKKTIAADLVPAKHVEAPAESVDPARETTQVRRRSRGRRL
jgi:conjugative relaxase-like TrwC/TraI family protein